MKSYVLQLLSRWAKCLQLSKESVLLEILFHHNVAMLRWGWMEIFLWIPFSISSPTVDIELGHSFHGCHHNEHYSQQVLANMLARVVEILLHLCLFESIFLVAKHQNTKQPLFFIETEVQLLENSIQKWYIYSSAKVIFRGISVLIWAIHRLRTNTGRFKFQSQTSNRIANPPVNRRKTLFIFDPVIG